MKMVQRSQRHKIIGGVCGGIGEYFDIDPVFIRLLFVIVSFFYGVGIIAYIVLWIIIPSAPLESAYSTTEESAQTDYETENTQNSEIKPNENKNGKNTEKARFLVGIVLFLIGILILINELIPYIDENYIWSSVFIIIGAYLIILSIKRRKSDEE